MSVQMDRRTFLKGLSLLTAGAAWPQLVSKKAGPSLQPSAPSILILVFDAVSARHMSLYGYQRETTPNLLRFAERATVFHAHYSAGNFTTPGTASLLTGTYPWSHRAYHLHGAVNPEFEQKTLFNAFSAAGYHTLAYSHNLLVSSLLHQFRQDLDTFIPTRELCLVDHQRADLLFPNDYTVAFWSEWLALRGGSAQPGSLLFSLLDQVLRERDKRNLEEELGNLFPRGIPELHTLFFILEEAIDRIQIQLNQSAQPFVAYYHLLPPHEPYNTRRDFVNRFRDNLVVPPKAKHHFSRGHSDEDLNRERQEYDEYLAYADAEFGRLYDFMVEQGVLDSTYVVVTTDHGELFERGIRGHITEVMFEPLIRIPLLVSQPGQRERQDVHAPTSSTDLLPTLLHATGQAVPQWGEGEILPTFTDKEIDSGRSIYSVDAKSSPRQRPLTKGTVALLKDRYKLIHYFGYDGFEDQYELFDLSNDPEELENLYEASNPVAAELAQEIHAKLQEVNRPWERQQEAS